MSNLELLDGVRSAGASGIDWHDGSVQYPITHYLHVVSYRTHTTSRASLWMTIFDSARVISQKMSDATTTSTRAPGGPVTSECHETTRQISVITADQTMKTLAVLQPRVLNSCACAQSDRSCSSRLSWRWRGTY